jgi:hypothetical protein
MNGFQPLVMDEPEHVSAVRAVGHDLTSDADLSVKTMSRNSGVIVLLREYRQSWRSGHPRHYARCAREP